MTFDRMDYFPFKGLIEAVQIEEAQTHSINEVGVNYPTGPHIQLTAGLRKNNEQLKTDT